MKNPTRICVILPRLPPAIDGIGDYTKQLWQQFHPDAPLFDKEESWYFLAANDWEQSALQFQSGLIGKLPRDPNQLRKALEEWSSDIVLLQFSGYGFDPNGIPYFLYLGLERWLRAGSNRRLVTMFHELYAVGPPWKKAFWLTALQQDLDNRLSSISSVSVTSNHDYLHKLQGITGRQDIQLIPIGSNFHNDEERTKDWSSLCIFGIARADSMQLHKELLAFLTKKGIVSTIVLCGQKPKTEEHRSNELAMLHKYAGQAKTIEEYDFPSDSIPESVARCGFSITNIRSPLLTKSGRFHLACDLGQVTISLKGANTNTKLSPLIDGVSFIEYEVASLDRLETKLRDTKLCDSIGQQAQLLAKTEFSWSTIVEKWRAILV